MSSIVSPITVEVVMKGLRTLRTRWRCTGPNSPDMMIDEVRDYCVGIVDIEGKNRSRISARCRSCSPMEVPPLSTAWPMAWPRPFRPATCSSDGTIRMYVAST